MAPDPNNMQNKNMEKDIETNSGVTIINEDEFEENNSSSGEGEENAQDEYDGYKPLQQDDNNTHASRSEEDSEESDDDEDEEDLEGGYENYDGQMYRVHMDIDYNVGFLFHNL